MKKELIVKIAALLIALTAYFCQKSEECAVRSAKVI